MIPWPAVIEAARTMVETAPIRPTLRALHYDLASTLRAYPNTQGAYRELGRRTAALRRKGEFPRLVDGSGREIERPFSLEGPDGARRFLLSAYRRNRSAGQPVALYLGLEKRTLVPYLQEWFSGRGIAVVALAGYSGEELVGDIWDEFERGPDVPRVLLYAGDFDPSGMYIGENYCERLAERGHTFHHVERVGLNHQDVAGMPESIQPVKPRDPRYPRFIRDCQQWGVAPVQVELDALPREELRSRFEAAIAPWWDESIFESVLQQEAIDRLEIESWAA